MSGLAIQPHSKRSSRLAVVALSLIAAGGFAWGLARQLDSSAEAPFPTAQLSPAQAAIPDATPAPMMQVATADPRPARPAPTPDPEPDAADAAAGPPAADVSATVADPAPPPAPPPAPASPPAPTPEPIY